MAEAEQHFILRVQDPELADKLRKWLRDGHTLDIRLLFDRPDSDRKGVLTVDGEQHEVWLQDLPTVVESYKTLDDANLVKVTDIGQVLLVLDPHAGAPDSFASWDGVTPPMRKARQRHFKPPITLPEPHMKEAVRDVLEILQGRAPDGYMFHDIEEEWVIDPATGSGKWVPVKPSKQPRAAAATAAEAAPKAARGGGRAARRKGAVSDEDDEDFQMSDSD